jgi:hypothetical protein
MTEEEKKNSILHVYDSPKYDLLEEKKTHLLKLYP